MRRSPEGIARFTMTGLVLKDGGSLDADIVVLATGYDNMRTTVRKVLGNKVADRCGDVWDLDGEGELNSVCLIPFNLSFFDLFSHETLEEFFTNNGIRSTDQAAIQASGSWAETSPSVESTPSSWPCK